jgi:hypothetical protein
MSTGSKQLLELLAGKALGSALFPFERNNATADWFSFSNTGEE